MRVTTRRWRLPARSTSAASILASSRIVDLKTPGSHEESHRNRWENIELLTQRDQVKFVICDANDYAWSRDVTSKSTICPARVGEVLFSPSHTELPAAQLAEWILRDRLRVRMQIQLHKVLWGNEPGR